MASNPVDAERRNIEDLRRAAKLLEEAEGRGDPHNAVRDPSRVVRDAQNILTPIPPRDDGMWEAGCGLTVLSRVMDNFGSQVGTRWAIRAARLALLLDAARREYWLGRRPIMAYDVGTTASVPITCKECGEGMGSLHKPGCPHERCLECGSMDCACLVSGLGGIVCAVMARRE